MLKLYLWETEDGKLRYGIGRMYRIIYLVFASAIAVGSIAYSSEPGFRVVNMPNIVMILLLLACCYQESWTYDADTATVTYVFGLIFLHKKRVYSFDSIERFELSHFKKGTRSLQSKVKSRANRLYLTFAMVMTDGERHDIEIIRIKVSGGRTELAASKIAQYCGKELKRDADVDEELIDG